ncbi:MAG: hypothetical protein RDV41_15760, partial [Planctomycetota bacterium]|nr:hypothetical protein [Planctomycetota bacterium]
MSRTSWDDGGENWGRPLSIAFAAPSTKHPVAWKEALWYVGRHVLEDAGRDQADRESKIRHAFVRVTALDTERKDRRERWVFQVALPDAPRPGGPAFRKRIEPAEKDKELPEMLQALLDQLLKARLGDVHVHSNCTRNLAEYGYSPWAIRAAGDAVGLDWSVLTDHACDYDHDINAQQVRHNPVPHPAFTASRESRTAAWETWESQHDAVLAASGNMASPHQKAVGEGPRPAQFVARHARDEDPPGFTLIQGQELHLEKSKAKTDMVGFAAILRAMSPFPRLIQDQMLPEDSLDINAYWRTTHALLLPDPDERDEPVDATQKRSDAAESHNGSDSNTVARDEATRQGNSADLENLQFRFVYSGSGTAKTARSFFLSILLPILADIWIDLDIWDPPDARISDLARLKGPARTSTRPDSVAGIGQDDEWRMEQREYQNKDDGPGKYTVKPMVIAAHPLEPPTSAQQGMKWDKWDFFDPETQRTWDFLKAMQIWNGRSTHNLRLGKPPGTRPDQDYQYLRDAFKGEPIPW